LVFAVFDTSRLFLFSVHDILGIKRQTLMTINLSFIVLETVIVSQYNTIPQSRAVAGKQHDAIVNADV